MAEKYIILIMIVMEGDFKMNEYRYKTRGHPSIKQLLAFLLALIVLVATTPPIWQRRIR